MIKLTHEIAAKHVLDYFAKDGQNVLIIDTERREHYGIDLIEVYFALDGERYSFGVWLEDGDICGEW